MSTPQKAELLNVLDWFADELSGTVSNYRGVEAASASRTKLEGLANAAALTVNSLAATPHDFDPKIAQQLFDLGHAVKEIAEGSTDPDYTASLNVAAGGLINFVLRHMPVQTSDGLRFDDRAPYS